MNKFFSTDKNINNVNNNSLPQISSPEISITKMSSPDTHPELSQIEIDLNINEAVDDIANNITEGLFYN